mgnify:CR=1 FL=1
MFKLLAEFRAELNAVARLMGEHLATREPRVAQLLDELGEFHGKMLRPVLVLAVARVLGPVEDVHRRLGAALEMIHTATLIHDDMIDEGDLRRGQPTAHVRFGNSTAVLLGDFFYTRAFHLVGGCGSVDLVQALTATTNIVCEGELHQMCARRDLTLSEAEYERIIYAKTAALTETACAMGAIRGTDDQRQAAAAYGRLCGLAFQIVDDCLDLSGDPQKVGKTLATDIERGRLTLPIIRLLAATPTAEREALGRRLLAVDGPADVEAVRRLVVDGGGVDSAMVTARSYIDQAIAGLDALPDNAARRDLAETASFIVARQQ